MESIELLKSVDEFYNSAWNKLMVYSSVLIAIVGIIIPIILTWWQNRTLKIKEESIKMELEATYEQRFADLMTEMYDFIHLEFEYRFEDFDNKVEASKGYSLHMLANNHFDANDITNGIISLCSAGSAFLKGNDFKNLLLVNDNLEGYFENLEKSQIEEIGQLANQPNRFVTELIERNENNIFSDFILKIAHTIKKQTGKSLDFDKD